MAVAERDLMAEEPERWHCTPEQFYRMGDMGLFEGQRVELIKGEIIRMPAMSSPRRTAVILVSDTLREQFGDGFFVSSQSPLDVDGFSDPEPDVAVIAGRARDYTGAHPTTAALVVEVSLSTLSHDRTTKSSLYAEVGIADYWLVNLKDRQVEVYRQPGPDADLPFGFGYASVRFYVSGETITPLAKPNASVAVADLLP